MTECAPLTSICAFFCVDQAAFQEQSASYFMLTEATRNRTSWCIIGSLTSIYIFLALPERFQDVITQHVMSVLSGGVIFGYAVLEDIEPMACYGALAATLVLVLALLLWQFQKHNHRTLPSLNVMLGITLDDERTGMKRQRTAKVIVQSEPEPSPPVQQDTEVLQATGEADATLELQDTCSSFDEIQVPAIDDLPLVDMTLEQPKPVAKVQLLPPVLNQANRGTLILSREGEGTGTVGVTTTLVQKFTQADDEEEHGPKPGDTWGEKSLQALSEPPVLVGQAERPSLADINVESSFVIRDRTSSVSMGGSFNPLDDDGGLDYANIHQHLTLIKTRRVSKHADGKRASMPDMGTLGADATAGPGLITDLTRELDDLTADDVTSAVKTIKAKTHKTKRKPAPLSITRAQQEFQMPSPTYRTPSSPWH